MFSKISRKGIPGLINFPKSPAEAGEDTATPKQFPLVNAVKPLYIGTNTR